MKPFFRGSSVPQGSVLGPLLFTLCTTPQSSVIRNNNLGHNLHADATQAYISLSTADTDLPPTHLDDWLSDISGWMTNNIFKFNADKTDFIIISTPRRSNKLTRFFPTLILNHSITLTHTGLNLGLTYESNVNLRKRIFLTYSCCIHHIGDLYRIRRYSSLSVAKTLLQQSLTNSLYNITSNDSAKVQCVQNYLAWVVTRSPRFSHSVPLLKSPHSISYHFETLYHCLSNSFFRRTLISMFHAFSSIQAQNGPFIWFSLVCSQG